MKCTNFPDPIICSTHHLPSIEVAGKAVGIDLMNPIDLSQMIVNKVTTEVKPRNDGRYYFECISELSARVFNDDGDPEELEIVITRKAVKLPNAIRDGK